MDRMTYEEAIKVLDRFKSLVYTDDLSGMEQSDHDKQAIKLAIEALEKQNPKKPIKAPYFYGETYNCPFCSSSLIYHYGNFAKFCPLCGQAIDWS